MDEERDSDFNSFTLISTATDSLSHTMSGSSEESGFANKLKAGKEWFQKKQAGTRSWGEFFNFKRLSRPSSIGDATGRLVTNIRYYSINYLFVFVGLAVYCIITNPILLIAMALCLLIYWFVSIKNSGENVSILGRQFSPIEIYTALAIIAVPVFYIAGAGSTIFWIIGASVVVILLHATVMTPPTSTSTMSGDEELGIIMEDITIS